MVSRNYTKLDIMRVAVGRSDQQLLALFDQMVSALDFYADQWKTLHTQSGHANVIFHAPLGSENIELPTTELLGDNGGFAKRVRRELRRYDPRSTNVARPNSRI